MTGHATLFCDLLNWQELGYPTNADAWHQALLLPDDFTVLAAYPTSDGVHGEHYRVVLASAHIPEAQPACAVLLAYRYAFAEDGNSRRADLLALTVAAPDGTTLYSYSQSVSENTE